MLSVLWTLLTLLVTLSVTLSTPSVQAAHSATLMSDW